LPQIQSLEANDDYIFIGLKTGGISYVNKTSFKQDKHFINHDFNTAQPILWNTLNNDGNLTNSKIGVDGANVGDLGYSSAMYDSGIYVNELDKYPEFLIDPYDIGHGYKFTMEYWFISDYDLIDGWPVPGSSYQWTIYGIWEFRQAHAFSLGCDDDDYWRCFYESPTE